MKKLQYYKKKLYLNNIPENDIKTSMEHIQYLNNHKVAISIYDGGGQYILLFSSREYEITDSGAYGELMMEGIEIKYTNEKR